MNKKKALIASSFAMTILLGLVDNAEARGRRSETAEERIQQFRDAVAKPTAQSPLSESTLIFTLISYPEGVSKTELNKLKTLLEKEVSKVNPSDRTRHADLLSCLATIKFALGDIDQSTKTFEEVSKLASSGAKPDYSMLVSNMVRESQMLEKAGRVAEAKACLQKAVEIATAHPGQNNFDKIQAATAMVHLLKNQGLLKDAMPYVQLALDQNNGIGAVYIEWFIAAKLYKEAQQLIAESEPKLEAMAKQYGGRSEMVDSEIRDYKALIKIRTNDLKGAAPLIEQSKKFHGDRPTASFTKIYLEFLQKSGRTAEALALQKQLDEQAKKYQQMVNGACIACGRG